MVFAYRTRHGAHCGSNNTDFNPEIFSSALRYVGAAACLEAQKSIGAGLGAILLGLELLCSLAGVALAADAGTTIDAGAIGNDTSGQNWAAYGRTYSEAHASPLSEINKNTIGHLGLVWSMELPGVRAAATVPLAVDGVLYFAVDRAVVHAVDAATGKELWTYDPEVYKVPGVAEPMPGIKLRQHWGTRGIAFWRGKVYVGTPDARLIAIDAKTGRLVWSRQTTKPSEGGNITGAPRAFDGLVLIGHGGSDVTPVRGYVVAYDAETGRERWRFYTVPGDPAKGFENKAMAMAAKTWSGKWWKYGGGGTVWNAMTYDPKMDRVYLGTGNGAPWNWHIRSPKGGDNLFIGSIVALDAKTGAYIWHYQATPGDSWDYDDSMDITLATLTIDGEPRKVILNAAKNGFFYVLDRESGKLVSAEKFAKVDWAERIDLQTGRPVLNPQIDIYYRRSETVHFWPSGVGAHSWQPMSFNIDSGLEYIPKIEMEGAWDPIGEEKIETWTYKLGQFNAGMQTHPGDIPANAGTSTLLAWDPVKQRKVWEIATPGVWNGGTMTTAGGLVFQGQGDGLFNAYAADSGKMLWSFDTHMGIAGAPITYLANGRQYVTVIAGWGASGAGFMGTLAAQMGWVSRIHTQRVVTFALDGQAQLPADLAPRQTVTPVDDPSFQVDAAKADEGGVLYSNTCAACHGSGAVAAGYAPDLRASAVPLSENAFEHTVREGGLLRQGMPPYAELSDVELEQLRHYIRACARAALRHE